jgi:FAD/FMN-containing dehydrogenase
MAMLNEPDDALLSELRAVLGDKGFQEPTETHLTERRGLFTGQAAALLRPNSTDEVAQVVKLCAAAGVGIVPWGGGTGLVGGQVKVDPPRPVLVSLERMRGVREISPEQNTITADAGATLHSVQQAALDADRLFPLSYASEGTATIGGGLAVNSGGLQAIRYGVARDLCLGLEVVTAEGEVWNGLSTLRKDNTGYDLRDLYIGSEGTLGIITGAVLRLYPVPRAKAAAFVSVADPKAAVDLLNEVQDQSGGSVAVFELMAKRAVDFGLAYQNDARLPVGTPSPWYVLVEIWGTEQEVLEGQLQHALERAMERGDVADATLAANEAQRIAFRELREALSDSQTQQGGSIKHDVSVPIAKIPEFIERANAAVTALIPDCRPVPFGHLGDGNIHYNVTQPEGASREDFLAQWDAVNGVVHDIVVALGGSISAEHGIGRLKRESLIHYGDSVKIALLRRLKAALDPKGIMNPGAVFAPVKV